MAFSSNSKWILSLRFNRLTCRRCRPVSSAVLPSRRLSDFIKRCCVVKYYISKCDEIGLGKYVITHLKERHLWQAHLVPSPNTKYSPPWHVVTFTKLWQLHIQPPVIVMTMVMRVSDHAGARRRQNSCGVQSAMPRTLFYLAEQLRGKQRLPLDNRGAPCPYSLIFMVPSQVDSPPRGEWSRT